MKAFHIAASDSFCERCGLVCYDNTYEKIIILFKVLTLVVLYWVKGK